MMAVGLPELVILATILVIGVGALIGLVVFLKASKLKQRLRDYQLQDERLSRRCDELTARIDHLETSDRIEHLSDLVRAGVRGGQLGSETGRQLEAFLQGLQSDD